MELDFIVIHLPRRVQKHQRRRPPRRRPPRRRAPRRRPPRLKPQRVERAKRRKPQKAERAKRRKPRRAQRAKNPRRERLADDDESWTRLHLDLPALRPDQENHQNLATTTHHRNLQFAIQTISKTSARMSSTTTVEIMWTDLLPCATVPSSRPA